MAIRPNVLLATALALGALGLIVYCRHPRSNVLAGSASLPTASTTNRLLSPRLQLPKAQAAATPVEPPSDKAGTTNLITRLCHGEQPPKLTAEQVEPYLAANHRNSASLLAAFRATGDAAFLEEAMQKYPNDPRVNLAAIFKAGSSSEERRQWLENFKQSDPNNSLPNYLSARDYFKSGQTDQALQEMSIASGKSGWQDYSQNFVQDAEEAYRAAGYSDVDAKTIASASLLLPHLVELKQMGQNLTDAANAYRQSGDTASAQSLLQMGTRFGQEMTESPTQPLITTLVGVAIQRIMLNAMDPNAPYDSAGQTVQNRIDDLIQQRRAIQALAQQSDGLFQNMSDQDLASYFDRRKSLGELDTLHWALNKYGRR
jgi:tetratricopeptide (TPR) repeat protein